jgi:hypothetical protein
VHNAAARRQGAQTAAGWVCVLAMARGRHAAGVPCCRVMQGRYQQTAAGRSAAACAWGTQSVLWQLAAGRGKQQLLVYGQLVRFVVRGTAAGSTSGRARRHLVPSAGRGATGSHAHLRLEGSVQRRCKVYVQQQGAAAGSYGHLEVGLSAARVCRAHRAAAGSRAHCAP